MSDLDDAMIELDETTPNMVVVEAEPSAPEAEDGTTMVFLRGTDDALVVKLLFDQHGVAAHLEAFLDGDSAGDHTFVANRSA